MPWHSIKGAAKPNRVHLLFQDCVGRADRHTFSSSMAIVAVCTILYIGRQSAILMDIRQCAVECLIFIFYFSFPLQPPVLRYHLSCPFCMSTSFFLISYLTHRQAINKHFCAKSLRDGMLSQPTSR